MPAAVEAIHVTKTYGSNRALDDLTLIVDQGECYGLVGLNGAGKTTLLRCLTGLASATSGDIRVLGLKLPAEAERVRSTAGVLIENPAFFPFLSGVENLRELSLIGGHRLGRDAALALLASAGLADAAERRVGGYSSGMRQRLGLAAALMHDPGLVILDEPTQALDPAGQADVLRLVADVHSEGRTVLFSSHALDSVGAATTRLAVIHDGRCLWTGKRDELLAIDDAPDVRSAFLGLVGVGRSEVAC